MFINVEGVLREFPDNVKNGDTYEIWDNCICIYYSEEDYYRVYYNATEGIKLIYDMISKPKYYKQGYASFCTENFNVALLNCKTGMIIVEDEIEIDSIKWRVSNKLYGIDCVIFKTYKDTYRMFDANGEELLEEHVSENKKIEFLGVEDSGFVHSVLLYEDRFHDNLKGVLHVFLKEGRSKVVEVLPPKYQMIYMDIYEAYEDKDGRYHFQTYRTERYDKKGRCIIEIFDFSGKRIR